MGFSLAEAIVYFKGDDSDLEKSLGDAEKKTESSAGSMAKMLGGLVAGAAVAAGAAIIGIGTEAFNVASDIDKATDQIGASLGYTGDDLKLFGDMIKNVYADNFGDSIEDVGNAIEETAKTLKLTAEDPSLQRMTENAFRLRDVFGVDVHDSLDAVRTLMDQFGVSGDEAFDLIADGYQRGLDRSGDFLDTIGEYSTQFSNGGASASEFFKVIETGAQGGVLGTDKAADAFKEFGIRIKDGSDLSKHSLGELGISFADLETGFTDGSVTAASAMQDILYKIFQIEDPITRARIGVGLFGTQWEDLGESGMKALSEIEEGFGVHEGIITSLDSKYTNLGSVMEGMWRQFQVGIEPAGEALLTLANDNLPLLQGVVKTVSDAIIGAVNLLPVAIAEVHKKWDEDWAGIRTTWENFARDLPAQHAAFWVEWNRTFNDGSRENQQNWEGFFGNLATFATSWWTITVTNWTESLKLIRGEWQLFSSLFKGDWEGTWEGFKTSLFAVTDIMLNYVEFVFGPGLRDNFAGALNGAWDAIKEVVGNIKDWWQGAWSWLHLPDLPGFPSAPSGGDSGFSGSGFSVPEFNMPSLTPGNWPVSASAAAGTVNHIQVNTTGGYENGYAAGEGIVDAMRFRGH